MDSEEKQREYYRNWYHQNGRRRAVDYVSNVTLWQKAHPEEVRAGKILRQAILNGEVIRPKFC